MLVLLCYLWRLLAAAPTTATGPPGAADGWPSFFAKSFIVNQGAAGFASSVISAATAVCVAQRVTWRLYNQNVMLVKDPVANKAVRRFKSRVEGTAWDCYVRKLCTPDQYQPITSDQLYPT